MQNPRLNAQQAGKPAHPLPGLNQDLDLCLSIGIEVCASRLGFLVFEKVGGGKDACVTGEACAQGYRELPLSGLVKALRGSSRCRVTLLAR